MIRFIKDASIIIFVFSIPILDVKLDFRNPVLNMRHDYVMYNDFLAALEYITLCATQTNLKTELDAVKCKCFIGNNDSN